MTLDTWLPEQVVFMARTGNAVANAVFEARLPKEGFLRPDREDAIALERFLRHKYVDHEWALRGEDGEVQWPPATPTATPAAPAAAGATHTAEAAHAVEGQQRAEAVAEPASPDESEAAGLQPRALSMRQAAESSRHGLSQQEQELGAFAAAAASPDKGSSIPDQSPLPVPAMADLLCLEEAGPASAGPSNLMDDPYEW